MQPLGQLALVAFTTLLVACSGAGADTVITDGLKDPSSYQRHSYNEMWKGKDSQGRPAYVAMVNYSATNSFGGRIRDCKLVAWAQVGNQVYWGGQAMTGCTGSSVEENRGQLDYFLDWNGFR